MNKRKKQKIISTIIAVILILSVNYFRDSLPSLNGEKAKQEAKPVVTTEESSDTSSDTADSEQTQVFDLGSIPEYSGSPYTVVNRNTPDFTPAELEKAKSSYKTFSNLDYLGRCGVAEASVGPDLLPKEKRGSIGMIKPSGWHTVRYDEVISDKFLFNRCHLIAFCLSGENANSRNLITGTRYLNVDGMLPFEEKTVKYVESTGNHVLYRVTPVFQGNDLVARGVHMEARSVEDNGAGISFNVYCYNVQPGITIDYATGNSHRS